MSTCLGSNLVKLVSADEYPQTTTMQVLRFGSATEQFTNRDILLVWCQEWNMHEPTGVLTTCSKLVPAETEVDVSLYDAIKALAVKKRFLSSSSLYHSYARTIISRWARYRAYPFDFIRRDCTYDVHWISECKHRIEPNFEEGLLNLQNRLSCWQNRTFPVDDTSEARRLAIAQLTMGMAEEVGEVAHAVLKMQQGIRGTSAEHLAAIADGICDTFIFGFNLASKLGICLEEILPKVAEQVMQRDFTKFPGNGIDK